jgi:hypothetical protein
LRKSRPNPTDALDASSHPAAKLETARASERRASFCGARPRSRVPGLGALAQARSGHPTCEPAGSRRRPRRGARRRRSRRIRSRSSSSTSAPPSRKRFSFSACRLLARHRYASSSNSTYSASTKKANPSSGERVGPYAWPSLSWPANRVRQVPDASGVRRKRGVLTNFEASSNWRAARSKSAWRSRSYRR